ncbi:MAG: hypothetical protein NZ807_14045 [Dehalococcoidia bacterium]|nr:hypothetical protein [Dehalococcoidia bacterium]
MNRFLIMTTVLLTTVMTGCPSGNNVVSNAEYRQIENGMSYSQVVTIIGYGGTESSSGIIEGVPGVMPSITTKLYMWQNSDGSNMNAMFQNDKLTSKAQFGLK